MGKYTAEPHYFFTNDECHHRYYELLKESQVWSASGQYWLARECELLAKQLLNGSQEHVNVIVKTENSFYKTKKFT